MSATTPVTFDLSFLRKRATAKRVVIVTLVCGVLGAGYALLAPKWYRSILTVVPATAQRPAISSMLGSAVAGVAGLESLAGSADAARITAVLQSVAVTDAVVEHFDLRTRYRVKYLESARDELWKHCDVKTLVKPNLVQMSCEDQDPRFVQKLLAYFAEYGNQVFRRVGVSTASEEVRFLEKRVTELRQHADGTADRVRQFQEKYGIVDLDTQAKAVVSALAALNTQRINKQLELDFARTFSSSDEASLRQLRSQLSVVDDRLRDLQQQSPRLDDSSRTDPKSARRDAFPAALAVPKLRADFEQLYRDRKVAEATLIFALERLEGARANEARDVSTFVVLDEPVVPTRKSRPQRAFIVAVASILGLVASVAFEWWRSVGGTARILGLPEVGTSAAPKPTGTRIG